MTNKKPLDAKAYFIFTLGLLLAVACFFFRSTTLSEQDRGPLALGTDAQNHTWVSTSKNMYVLGPKGEILAQNTLEKVGIAQSWVIDFTAWKTGVLALARGGFLAHCTFANSAISCQPFELTPKLPQGMEGKIRAAPNGLWLAISSNGEDRAYLYDANGQRLSASQASAPLDHPNGLFFTETALVLANTGKYALESWPYTGTTPPALDTAPNLLLKVGGQPYFLEQPSEGEWLVLQAGSMLYQGRLARYPSGVRLDQDLSDPVSLKMDGQKGFVLAGMDDFALTRLTPAFKADLTWGEGINQALSALKTSNENHRKQARLALIACLIFFLSPALLLHLMGYELNQAVGGKKKQASPSHLKISRTQNALTLKLPMSFKINETRKQRRILWMTIALLGIQTLPFILFTLLTKDARHLIVPSILVMLLLVFFWFMTRITTFRKIVLTQKTLFIETQKGIAECRLKDLLYSQNSGAITLGTPQRMLLIQPRLGMLTKSETQTLGFALSQLCAPSQSKNIWSFTDTACRRGWRWGQILFTLNVLALLVAALALLLVALPFILRLLR